MTESYTIGGDTLYELKEPKLVGQTFSPLKDHTLEYIDLSLKRTTLGGRVWITLHDLDTDPDMSSGGISKSKKVTWEPRNWTDITRVRFSMAKKKVYINKVYGILVHSETAPWWNVHKVQYDAAGATYIRGRRFTKDGIMDPPTYHEGSDLIFTEFGEILVPYPPYEPPVNLYAILDIKQFDTGLGIKFIVTTNVPCHLWMVWTNQEPWHHLVRGQRRGAWVIRDVRFCFVDFHANEQLEEGDTIYHTFVKEPWEVCETRWFTFKGKVGDYFTTSASAIFAKHRIGLPQIPACGNPDKEELITRILSGEIMVKPFKPGRSYMATKLTQNFSWAPYVGYVKAEYIHLLIYKCKEDGYPEETPLRRIYCDIDLMTWPGSTDVTALFEPLVLEAGQAYAFGFETPAVEATPEPWSCWWRRGFAADCHFTLNWYNRVWRLGGWLPWSGGAALGTWYYELPEAVFP